MRAIVVIPTYNEKDNISNLIEEIFKLNINDLKVLVVDDNSPDRTADKVLALKDKYNVELISREKKLGLGSAYLAGFQQALNSGADMIFEMDADFSHDPKEIPNFIQEIKNGNDLVIGSRKIKGGRIVNWGPWRKFCSGSAMMFSRIVLGLKTKDVTSGYRCYRRQVLESLDLDKIKSNGYAFQEEMIWLCENNNMKIKEIPICFVDRRVGKSKLSWRDVTEFFINMIKLRIKG